MYLIIFLIVNIIFLNVYYSRLPKLIIFTISLCIIFVEPVFQKLTDPTLYGSTYMIYSFSRLQTYLVLTAIFLIIFLFPRNKNQVSKINIYFIILLLFQILNVLFSINLTNSFAIFLVGIVFPLLFMKFLQSLGIEFFMDNEDFKKAIYLSIICFISIGFLMLGNSGMTANEIGVNRTAGGLWISNVSTQVLSIFFPFILLKSQFKINNILRLICVILYLSLLIVSLSRTGFIVYTFMILLTIFSSKKRIYYIILSVISIYILLFLVNMLLNIDFIEMISTRFTKSGNFENTIETDGRIFLLKEIFENYDPSTFLIGNGISTFNLVNKFGFSNAHNLYINIFIERGIIGLVLFIYAILYLFKKSNKFLKNKIVNDTDKSIIKSFRTGLIGFLLIGFTGNDLFINSGFINGWPLIIIIIYYVVLEMKIKKIENDIKNKKNGCRVNQIY